MKTSALDVAKRRLRMIALLSEKSRTARELIKELRQLGGARTINKEIAWLKTTFPQNMRVEKVVQQDDDSRVLFSWIGPEPLLVDNPATWLTEFELVALVAAKGLLRQPSPRHPTTDRAPQEGDLLASAVHEFIERMGIPEPVRFLRDHHISVSRFGVEPIDPGILATCIRATILGDALQFTYSNLENHQHEAHAAPKRMVLIHGEWYVMAWADVLRMYKVSRISIAVASRRMPDGMPASIPSAEVNAQLDSGFFATNSGDLAARRVVVLAVSPGAWPFVRNRWWGDRMMVDEQPGDLDSGWRRLTFTTTGLAECKHWVLGMGTGVKVEQPAELAQWIADEAQGVVQHYAQ
jgi:predicted DNA-binding transcriptional regulator YafY